MFGKLMGEDFKKENVFKTNERNNIPSVKKKIKKKSKLNEINSRVDDNLQGF